jgi:hypothetical protein
MEYSTIHPVARPEIGKPLLVNRLPRPSLNGQYVRNDGDENNWTLPLFGVKAYVMIL